MLFPKAFRERRIDDRLQPWTFAVSLDDGQYQAIDWSLSGILLADYYGMRWPGQELDGTFQICTDMSSRPFRAVVVRRNLTAGRLAIKFIDLDPTAASVLEAFMSGHRGN